jgi:hypothetical protein
VCDLWLKDAAQSDTRGHLDTLQAAVDELRSAYVGLEKSISLNSNKKQQEEEEEEEVA